MWPLITLPKTNELSTGSYHADLFWHGNVLLRHSKIWCAIWKVVGGGKISLCQVGLNNLGQTCRAQTNYTQLDRQELRIKNNYRMKTSCPPLERLAGQQPSLNVSEKPQICDVFIQERKGAGIHKATIGLTVEVLTRVSVKFVPAEHCRSQPVAVSYTHPRLSRLPSASLHVLLA